MSGLYNMLFGVSPNAGLMMASLRMKPDDFPRWRDAFWNGTHICVYTRAGGINRGRYEAEIEAVRKHPEYVEDTDDTYDNTYATFRFNLHPDLLAMDEVKDALPDIAEPERAALWQKALEKLKG